MGIYLFLKYLSKPGKSWFSLPLIFLHEFGIADHIGKQYGSKATGLGGHFGGLDALKDGPLGKIMTIVERKVKEKVEAGGMDELKSILDSTKDILGKNPEEMKETLVRIL